MQNFTELKTPERNYGIDLLRILSMIMIVTLHVLGHGGILKSLQTGYRSDLVWLIEILCYGAVNCFALITGYVYYGKKTKYSNIITLCFQVAFYTLIPFIVKTIIEPKSFSIINAVKAVFPFAYKTYWFFSAYFCLFFFIPLLNKFVGNLNRKQTFLYLVSGFFVFSIIPTMFHYDTANTLSGYSFIWLAFLYSVGALIRKTNWSFKSKKQGVLIFSICILITWISRILIRIITTKVLGYSAGQNYLLSYVSPTILISSISVFSVFSSIKANKFWSAISHFFAPISFGVYLFHESPIIRELLITDRFSFISEYRILIMIPLIVLSVFTVWLVSSIIDYLRLLLFKLLRINKLSKAIENIFRKLFSKFIPE